MSLLCKEVSVPGRWEPQSRDTAEGDLQLTLLEAAVMKKGGSRYIEGILLEWKTELLHAESCFSAA